MILFLDTSALVKLYIEEAGGDLVLRAMQSASLIAVSELTLVETHSALARLSRERQIAPPMFAALRRDVNADFREFYFQVRVSEKLRHSACRLLAKHPLRSMDALQLASALNVKRNSRPQFVFASFDARLNRTASAAGLETLRSIGGVT